MILLYNLVLSTSVPFIYFLTARESTQAQTGEGQKEERESQAGSVVSVQSPSWGSNSRTMRS